MKTLLFTISIFLFFYLNDFAQEAKLMIPVGHTDKVNSATFSPDGKKVITASSDHTAKIWDANTGVLLAVLNANKDDVRAASFSNDGKIVKTISWGSVAAGSGYSVKIWNAYTGILLREIKGHTKQINSVSVSADGLKTIAAPDDHSLKIVTQKQGKAL